MLLALFSKPFFLILNTETDSLISCSDNMMAKPFLFWAWRGQHTLFEKPLVKKMLHLSGYRVILAASWYWGPDAQAMNIPTLVSLCGLNIWLGIQSHTFVSSEMKPVHVLQKVKHNNILFFFLQAYFTWIHLYELLLKRRKTLDNLEAIRVKELRKVAELLVIW